MIVSVWRQYGICQHVLGTCSLKVVPWRQQHENGNENLVNIETLATIRLSANVCPLSSAIMALILLVLWYLLTVYRAALLWTDSIFATAQEVCGSQTDCTPRFGRQEFYLPLCTFFNSRITDLDDASNKTQIWVCSDPSTFCRTSEKKIQDILQDFRSQFRYTC